MQFVEIETDDFDLEKTLNSGQVFHWERIENGFVGTIDDLPVCVDQHGAKLLVESAADKLDRLNRSSSRTRPSRMLIQTVRHYFALDHPLADICRSFPNDPTMNAAQKFCRGLRIIRQPKWECLATFICSSMKQVAHIRQIVAKLRERFGEPYQITLHNSIRRTQGGSAAPSGDAKSGAKGAIVNIEQGTARSTNNHIVFSFPPADRIASSSEAELRKCALGYRAKNLLATARLVASGEADLESWAEFPDVDLRERLCSLPGVGAKVANCVMLFAYERLRAFPIDVWIERVLRQQYFPRSRKLNAVSLRQFTEKYFGEHGGYAQQYLFHHARTSKNGRVPRK